MLKINYITKYDTQLSKVGKTFAAAPKRLLVGTRRLENEVFKCLRTTLTASKRHFTVLYVHRKSTHIHEAVRANSLPER